MLVRSHTINNKQLFAEHLMHLNDCQNTTFNSLFTIVQYITVNLDNQMFMFFSAEPQFNAKPDNILLSTIKKMNEPHTVSCSATGLPLPEILWYKEGNILSPDEHITVLYEIHPDKSECTSTLTLKYPQLSQLVGTYEVRLSNIAGTKTYQFMRLSDFGKFFHCIFLFSH